MKKKKDFKQSARRIYNDLLDKAGMSISLEKLLLTIFRATIFISLLISAYAIFKFSLDPNTTITYILIIMVILWTLIFVAMFLIIGLLFFFYIDVKIYQRKIGIENVFPDFLQLTSANIRAGMPIDQALWHAIRPNFGVLAKEMENVAKQTMSGTDLEQGLTEFSKKYDSDLLKRSISLLIEGLNAGGEIGELLDRISTNIQESRMIQKEMAASVTTYAIFISFASIAGAPFLLALSSQLLKIIEQIIADIEIPESGGGMTISFSSVGVTPADFKIFAIVTLIITSIMSAAIVATIKKGNIKEGLKYIPAFVIATLVIYLLLDLAFGVFIKGMI